MSDPTTTPVVIYVCDTCGRKDFSSLAVRPGHWTSGHKCGGEVRRIEYHPSSAPSEAGAQEADCPSSEKQLEERVRVLEEALRVDDKLIVALSDLAQARRYNQASQWAVDARAAAEGAKAEYDRARKALSGGGE